jgi:tetratricopeptide (TPR) repeat protein
MKLFFNYLCRICIESNISWMKTRIILLLSFLSLIAFAQQPSLTPQKIRQISNSIFTIYTYDADGKYTGAGSGFIIGSNGLCVTNFHVLEDAFRADVKLKSGEKLRVRSVTDFNASADLVKFRLEAPSGRTFPTLRLSGRLPMQGDDIVNISTPFGIFEQTFSKGNVATVRRHSDHGYLIQVTAPFSQGSSGSPIVNANGEVVGVATMIFKYGQNMNFAVSSIKLLQMNGTRNIPLADMTKDPLVTRYIKQARAAFKRNKLDNAVAMAQTELRRNPQNSVALSLMGEIFYTAGDYEKSTRYFQKAYSISNRDEDKLYYGLSMADLGMAKNGDMQCFRIAYPLLNEIAKNHRDPFTYYYIGNLLYEYTVTYKRLRGAKLQEALNALDYSLQLEPHSFTFAARGEVKAAMNDMGGALVDYDNAIKLNSQYYKPYFLRGKLRSLNFGNLEAGLEDAEKALRLVGNQPKIKADILYTQAQIYHRLASNTGNGSFAASAINKLDEAYRLNQKSEYLAYRKQLAHNNYDEAEGDAGDYFDIEFNL